MKCAQVRNYRSQYHMISDDNAENGQKMDSCFDLRKANHAAIYTCPVWSPPSLRTFVCLFCWGLMFLGPQDAGVSPAVKRLLREWAALLLSVNKWPLTGISNQPEERWWRYGAEQSCRQAAEKLNHVCDPSAAGLRNNIMTFLSAVLSFIHSETC